MTIWVLHQTLPPEEEARLFEREHVQLPFEGLPDLTLVGSPHEARRLISVLHPGEPPEAIARRVEKFWDLFNNVQIDDVIAVPLVAAQQVVLAEVTGRYRYEVGAHGADVHLLPVRWVEKRVPLAKFGKHKGLFAPGDKKMKEVMFPDERTAIRDHLPHSYNRFAKYRWMMWVFFALGSIRLIEQLLRQ